MKGQGFPDFVSKFLRPRQLRKAEMADLESHNHGMDWPWSARQEEAINELNVSAGIGAIRARPYSLA